MAKNGTMVMGNDIESPGSSTAAEHDDAEPLPPVLSDESSAMNIKKLGRRRPDAFSSRWVEVGFCISVLGSMMLAEFLVSGFNGTRVKRATPYI